jgi:hypothetical protein
MTAVAVPGVLDTARNNADWDFDLVFCQGSTDIVEDWSGSQVEVVLWRKLAARSWRLVLSSASGEGLLSPTAFVNVQLRVPAATLWAELPGGVYNGEVRRIYPGGAIEFAATFQVVIETGEVAPGGDAGGVSGGDTAGGTVRLLRQSSAVRVIRAGGARGRNAKEVAIDGEAAGLDPTASDGEFADWLRQPATDAAADLGEAVTGGLAQIETAGADGVAAVNAAGTSQVAAVNAAGAAQISSVDGAGSAQVAEVDMAGFVQVAAVNGAGDTQVSLIISAGGVQVVGAGSAGDIVGDGVADVAAALQEYADNDVGAEQALRLLPGVYVIGSDITLDCLVLFSPGARLKPSSGVTVHLAGGYDASDYQWVFDLSAGGKVTGDSAARGYTTDIHFGAKGDAVTDDSGAFQAAVRYATRDAIRYEFACGVDIKLPMTGQNRRWATTPLVNRTIHVFGGVAVDRSISGIEIVIDDGQPAAIIIPYAGGNSAPGGWTGEYGLSLAALFGGDETQTFSGLRAQFSDIHFRPATPGGVKYGVWHNAVAFFNRVSAENFESGGFFAHAQTSGAIDFETEAWSPDFFAGRGVVWGNVNQSRYVNCWARSTTNGCGFIARGNNAGIVLYDQCDASNNTGAGFFENTSIGCQYSKCTTAGNVQKVEHGGVYYMALKPHLSAAANEPGVGASWTTYWMVLTTATIGDVVWGLDVVYGPSGAINVFPAASATYIDGHYTEGGIEIGIIGREKTTIVGGVVTTSGRVPYHPEFSQCNIVDGITPTFKEFRGRNMAGDNYGASLGQRNNDTGVLMTWGHSGDSGSGGPTANMRMQWLSSRNSYTVTRGTSTVVEEYFTPATNSGGYTGIETVAFRNGVLLGGSAAANNVFSRVRAANNLAAITAATMGPAVRGERWFYAQPSPSGKTGAVCTTAGTLGSTAVIKEFGVIDA